MIVHERIDEDGRVRRTELEPQGDAVALVEAIASELDAAPDRRGPLGLLPRQAVVAVMRRYGRPLDDRLRAEGPTFELGDGARLRRFRFRARVDADVRDYLVLEQAEGEPLAVLSSGVASALRYLVERTGG